MGSRARGLSSCSSQALEDRLNSCGTQTVSPWHGMWDIPGSGIEPVSPAIGRRILYHWATREAPSFFSKGFLMYIILVDIWIFWFRSLGWEESPGEGLPTPVFWPREFHGLYSSWGRKESDMTERISLPLPLFYYNHCCSEYLMYIFAHMSNTMYDLHLKFIYINIYIIK